MYVCVYVFADGYLQIYIKAKCMLCIDVCHVCMCIYADLYVCIRPRVHASVKKCMRTCSIFGLMYMYIYLYWSYFLLHI